MCSKTIGEASIFQAVSSERFAIVTGLGDPVGKRHAELVAADPKVIPRRVVESSTSGVKLDVSALRGV